MSTVGRDHTGRTPSGFAGFVDRLSQPGRRFIVEHTEGTIVLSALAAFVVLWMVFDVVSLASVDLHPDWSEAALWAHHFAFGYKHPPMTAWLFMLWFAVFPRQDWAADLLNVLVVAIGLGVTWRLLRDHLDKNRALLGLVALVLIPLYDIKTAILNANTVMIPFWAAALLFYLRARRGLGILDAFLAGAFASLTVFGKVLGAVSGCRHGGCLSCRPGDATLLALARAVRHGAGGCNRHCASCLVVRERARRHQLRVHARHRRSQPVIRDGAAALGTLPYQLRRLCRSCRLFFSPRFGQAGRRSLK